MKTPGVSLDHAAPPAPTAMADRLPGALLLHSTLVVAHTPIGDVALGAGLLAFLVLVVAPLGWMAFDAFNGEADRGSCPSSSFSSTCRQRSAPGSAS